MQQVSMGDFDEDEGFFPGCLLIGVNDMLHGIIPLSAWPALQRWHQNPNSLPIVFIDQFGHQCQADRVAVVQIARRDEYVCAALAANARHKRQSSILRPEP
jgi:hypothetical protein